MERRIRFDIDPQQYQATPCLDRFPVLLLNRRSVAHTMRLVPLEHSATAWIRYRCETSCRVQIDYATLEAIWSRCGRYLALLCFACANEQEPSKIALIDFETSALRWVPVTYPCASFIGFEAGWLDFSYLLPPNREGRRIARHVALTGTDHQIEQLQSPDQGKSQPRKALGLMQRSTHNCLRLPSAQSHAQRKAPQPDRGGAAVCAG